MRIAALFCGLIAGLFALLAPIGLDVDLLSPFLKSWGVTPGQQLLGTIAWYAPAGAAILGGLLAAIAPGPGAVLLLVASAAWAIIGVFDTSFFRLELLGPAGLAVIGAVLAFVVGEMEQRRWRQARRSRRDQLRETYDRGDMEDRAREAAFSMDPLTVTREEAPPRPAREIPLTLDEVAPVEPEPRRSRSETIWPDSPGRRPIFERADAEPELTPRRSLFERPVLRVDRPSRQERRESSRRDDYDDSPAPRRNMLVWIVAVNAVILIGLAIGVGYMLVNARPSSSAAAVADAGTDTTTVAAIPGADASADPNDRLIPNLWPALALPGDPAEAPKLQLPMPAAGDAPAANTQVAEVVPPVTGGISDPYAYCNAIKTIDYVDSRYTGPRFTPDIAEALRVPVQSAPDRVSWRCVDGVVYACASFDWPVCSMTPTAQEMLDYCKRNPGVSRLLAPNGTWSCEGTRPKIPEGASWPVDARGFFPNAWIPVLPPQRPTG